MIKWFCDLCGKEIVAPETPVYVKGYRVRKSRDDEEIGWGESDYFVELLNHSACADTLQAAIVAAVQQSKTIKT